MNVVDAHLHMWSLATPGHEWPTAAVPTLHRDFGTVDLLEATGPTSLAGAVLVQSQPTDADTEWMLTVAEHVPLVLGVVGWVDLSASDAAGRIAELANRAKLRGLRPMLQAIEDTEWLMRDDLAPAIDTMVAHGLSLDALAQPRHLPMLARFSDRWPRLSIVIDHAAKPNMASSMRDPWWDGIVELAGRGLHCKLSGLRTEQTGSPCEKLTDCVKHLVANFGDRLMWGSDWPVLTLSGDTYAGWLDDARRLADLAGASPERLFGESARQFYALGDVM